MRKLKVYGGYVYPGGKSSRAVVAAYCQAQVSQITHQSMYSIQYYWSKTANAEEIQRALANPFQVIIM